MLMCEINRTAVFKTNQLFDIDLEQFHTDFRFHNNMVIRELEDSFISNDVGSEFFSKNRRKMR